MPKPKGKGGKMKSDTTLNFQKNNEMRHNTEKEKRVTKNKIAKIAIFANFKP